MAMTRAPWGAQRLALISAAVIIATQAACGSATPQFTPVPRSATTATSPTASPPCSNDKWTVAAAVTPRNIDPNFQQTGLTGMAAVTASDVWAVGGYIPKGQASTGVAKTQTLTEHWDGSRWSIVSAPDTSAAQGDTLVAVAAVASKDVWAVGYSGSPGGSSVQAADGTFSQPPVQTLVEHWDGTHWRLIASPDVTYLGHVLQDQFTSVVAISATDVWAAGLSSYGDVGGLPTPSQPLVEHWDGTAWHLATAVDPVARPSAADFNGAAGFDTLLGGAEFDSIAAVSATDIWAVGSYRASQKANAPGLAPRNTLTEHWNGVAWSVVAAPDVSLQQQLDNGSKQADDQLLSVAVGPTGDIWAGGDAAPLGAVVLHRTAAAWNLTPTPTVSSRVGAGAVTGIVVNSADVWTVGAAILHWHGGAWTPLYTVNGQNLNAFSTATRVSDTEFWAAGPTQMLHHTCL